ncbi:hypothetical protein BU17DRAFT_87469 [Hysterangium stoloniferum]|nr:hypothetical protein BU17DRAFT_87469 [Hysterangium stoloniferum]
MDAQDPPTQMSTEILTAMMAAVHNSILRGVQVAWDLHMGNLETMHPLLQAGFLPGDIRNGSGNGGAVLFLMMPVVEDPYDPKSRTEAQKTAFAFLK